MNWTGSGFIPILIYTTGGGFPSDNFALLTESGLNILTEDGKNIDIEH